MRALDFAIITVCKVLGMSHHCLCTEAPSSFDSEVLGLDKQEVALPQGDVFREDKDQLLPLLVQGLWVKQVPRQHQPLNPILLGVFLVLLFKFHVDPRKNFIRWKFFEKS